MAIARHFSIRLLMMAILLIAVDFAIVPKLNGGSFRIYPATAVAILPMINLLILTLPRLRKRSKTRLYWSGFHGVGWLMVLMIGYLTAHDPNVFFAPVSWLEIHPPAILRETDLTIPVLFTLIIILYTTPQLLAAQLAGWLFVRYCLVNERRSNPLAADHPSTQ